MCLGAWLCSHDIQTHIWVIVTRNQSKAQSGAASGTCRHAGCSVHMANKQAKQTKNQKQKEDVLRAASGTCRHGGCSVHTASKQAKQTNKQTKTERGCAASCIWHLHTSRLQQTHGIEASK